MREAAAAAGRRAVFLDRDGTLNQDSPDFVKTADEMRILPGAGAALARLARAGLALVVVTNQSAIARGLTTEAELERMHAKLRAALAVDGAALLDILRCPHGPADGCACRKPMPGMILTACARHGIDARRSFMIGDKESDVLAGRRAGCRAVLLASARPAATEADHVSPSLAEAAAWVVARAGEEG